MTGGSPTSGADPPPIRCSIRSVIRTFWRARARANAPDADDASGGRRCLAARYGEKRGAFRAPRFSPYAAPSLRSLSPCGPPPSPSSRFRGRRLHCRSGGALPQWGAHCVQWLSRCLRRVQRRRRRRRRRRRARPRNAPCTRGDGGKSGRARIGAPGASGAIPGARFRGDPTPPIGMARFRRSWGVWRRPGGCVRGGNDGDARRPIGVGRRESASVGVNQRRSASVGAMQ